MGLHIINFDPNSVKAGPSNRRIQQIKRRLQYHNRSQIAKNQNA